MKNTYLNFRIFLKQVIPFLFFLFLLAHKLDSISPLSHTTLQFNFVSSSSFSYLNFQQMSWFTVFTPLYISLITLICLSFFGSSRSASNSWWFGIRKDFGSLLPKSWMTYANISYNKQQTNTSDNQVDIPEPKQIKPKTSSIPVSPALTLDVPD